MIPIYKIRILDGSTLKLIAILTMLTDHIGAVLYPDVTILRCVGRIAFPIFVFLLVEGFFHSGNVRRYLFRLIIFAFISEIPFDLAFSGRVFDPESQNVFFTLAIGLAMMMLLKYFDTVVFVGCSERQTFYGYSKRKAPHRHSEWKILFQFLTVIVSLFVSWFLSADYTYGGIALIFCFYFFKDKPACMVVSLAAISLIFYSGIELFSLFAFVPIFMYNGRRGYPVKYAFYIFYPAHLTIIFLLAALFFGAYAAPGSAFGLA